MSHKLRHVRQRTKTDCGIAAVASACGRSYAAVLNSARSLREERGNHSMLRGDITRTVRALGCSVKPMPLHELRVGDVAIAATVERVVDGLLEWHWIVIHHDGSPRYVVLDPERSRPSRRDSTRLGATKNVFVLLRRS